MGFLPPGLYDRRRSPAKPASGGALQVYAQASIARFTSVRAIWIL